jgi:oligoribonuclease NrnB/cAMP/cGMP phosphodiesterase (DHH superfamily)
MELIPPLITIDEFKIDSLNFSKKFLNISFGYSSSLKGLVSKSKLVKKFAFGDNTVNFILDSMAEIKKFVGTATAKIDKEEEMKEKLVNIMTRIMTEISGLERISDHEQYMKAFNRLNCYKVTFPEIEMEAKRDKRAI